jgi:hypothetical protein
MQKEGIHLLWRAATILVLMLAGCAHQPAAQTSAALSIDAQHRQDQAVAYAIRTGYQETPNDKGIKTYCRLQTVIGTHFSNRVCYTPEQLSQMFANEDSLRDKLVQPFTCTNSLTCGRGQ